MTVEKLILELSKIQDKSMEVVYYEEEESMTVERLVVSDGKVELHWD